MVKLKGGRFACASKDFCFVLLRLAKVLDSVSSASDLAKLETIYELTLDALKATANQRPLRFERVSRLLVRIRNSCFQIVTTKNKLIFLAILSGHSRELEASMPIRR